MLKQQQPSSCTFHMHDQQSWKINFEWLQKVQNRDHNNLKITNQYFVWSMGANDHNNNNNNQAF
jgi:hypothetical protein